MRREATVTMIQAQKTEKGTSPARLSRRQREAVRFIRFWREYRRNGSNAYRAALAVGYSERMARAKSYRLGQLVEAAERFDRLGFKLVAQPNSYCSASPETASPHEDLQASANENSEQSGGGTAVGKHLEPPTPAVAGVAPDEVSYQEDSENPKTGKDGRQRNAEPHFYGFVQRRRRFIVSRPAKPTSSDEEPDPS